MSNQSSQMTISATMVALYNFEAEDEPEISMKKGDRIEMLDMDPALNGWAYGRKKTDGSEGYVPISYLGTSNANNNRSHKHSKTGNQPSRSSSPNPSKQTYDNKSYARQNTYSRNQNTFSSQLHNNNQNNQSNDNNISSNTTHNQQNNINNNNNNNNSNNINHQNNSNKTQTVCNQSNVKMNNNQSNANNNQSNTNLNSNANDSIGPDAKQIICSFHRDFIPEMNDLYKYFGEFGKITNKLEIEYDAKKVPLAKIKFSSASCVDKVCDKGGRQQIPSGAQNGTIHIRVYRSMQDYINNTQRSNRSHGTYNKHKNSRRGGF